MRWQGGRESGNVEDRRGRGGFGLPGGGMRRGGGIGIGTLLITLVLGWFLGKCMVETRGLLWPWFIHFLQDVVIFTFLAAGALRPGG